MTPKLPGRLFEHVWRALQEKRAKALRERIDALVARLSEILAADYARSDEARSEQRLRASFGGRDTGIDFGALAGLLKRALPERPMAESRRRRIASLLGALRTLDFGPFVYDSCAEALAAYRARLPHLIALSKAIAAARLEAAGEYAEERHDAFFAIAGSTLLAEEGLADFPGMLVRLDGAAQDPQLAEILALGAPVKVLVQFDDILQRSPVGRPGFGLRAHALAGMALGLPDVYVLQCCASQLYELGNQLLKGLEYPGAALFSVYSGAGGETELRAVSRRRGGCRVARFPRFLLRPFCRKRRALLARRQSAAGRGSCRPRSDVRRRSAPASAAEGPLHLRRFRRLRRPLCRLVRAGAAVRGRAGKCALHRGGGQEGRAAAGDRRGRAAVGEARRCLEFWRSLQQRVVKKPEVKPVEKGPSPGGSCPPPRRRRRRRRRSRRATTPTSRPRSARRAKNA